MNTVLKEIEMSLETCLKPIPTIQTQAIPEIPIPAIPEINPNISPIVHASVRNSTASTSSQQSTRADGDDDYEDTVKLTVPGIKMFSKAHHTQTLIIADSTIRNISPWQLKENVASEEKEIIIRRHPGSTADEMSHFCKDSIKRFRPNNLIIFAGTNDVGRAYRERNVNEWKIAEDILKIAQYGKRHGCKQIFVSSVLVRQGKQYENIIKRVNDILLRVCGEEGFHFLDHSDVETRHLCGDGLHPNNQGTAILKMNVLQCFNTFNPYLSNFCEYYENAVL